MKKITTAPMILVLALVLTISFTSAAVAGLYPKEMKKIRDHIDRIKGEHCPEDPDQDALIQARKIILEIPERDTFPEGFLRSDLKPAKLLPKNHEKEFYRARRLFLEGKYDEALKIFNKLGDYSNSAECLIKLGRLSEAADMFFSAGEQAKYLRTLELAVKDAKGSELVTLKTRLARVYAEKGENLKAAKIYEELGSSAMQIIQLEKGGDFNNAARILEDQGNLKRAAQLFEAAKKASKAAEIYKGLGMYQKEFLVRQSMADLSGMALAAKNAGWNYKAAKLYFKMANETDNGVKFKEFILVCKECLIELVETRCSNFAEAAVNEIDKLLGI